MACLQQIHAHLLTQNSENRTNYGDMIQMVMDLVYESWEDPFEAIGMNEYISPHCVVNEIRGIFKEILDINDLMNQGKETDQFLEILARQLVQMPWTIKGKYPILNILMTRIGALHLIKSEPDLLSHLYGAMRY